MIPGVRQGPKALAESDELLRAVRAGPNSAMICGKAGTNLAHKAHHEIDRQLL